MENKNKELLDRYFEGKATHEEVKMLFNQLDNVDFEKNQLKEHWDAMSTTMNVKVQNQIFQKITEVIAPKRSLNLTKWLAIAASIVVVLTSTLSIYLYVQNRESKLVSDMKFQVERGQKASIILPDGSKVWVNSGSTLMYGSRYNKNERIINLDGEAYFEVAPNKDAPFIVQSHGFSVKALGTAFDVRAYAEDNQFSTVLVHGKVEVGDGDKKLYLEKNQKIVYDRLSRKMEKRIVEDSNQYAQWRNNQLTFDSETFENIALALERNYNVRLVFESESLKKYHYSGSLGNSSLESVLQLFTITSPLSYRIQDSVIYLTENRKMTPLYNEITRRTNR